MATTRRVYLLCDRCAACFNPENTSTDGGPEETVHGVREHARRYGKWARVSHPTMPGRKQDVCATCMGRPEA